MVEKKHIPAIRFKGFTDPWEQRKLGDFTGKVTEKNTGMRVTETFTNSAEFGVISQLDFFDHAVSKDESISGYTIVCPADFVYNPRISVTAPVGPINRNRLNRAGVMSPLYTVFRTDESIDRVYLEHFFKTLGWHSYMQLNGNSGARSDRFSIGDDTFFAMPIPAPGLEEQRQLAGFLESLDTLITLHQRKYEKLVTIKKSMLEKMFPREGSHFPEIRFAGFTDPWEQRKLSEVFTNYTDPVNIPHDGYERLGIRSHAKGTFHSYVPAGHELQTAQMHRVAANKFIVNITFGWEHAVAVTDENDAGKLVSHRFPQFSLSEELDPRFLKYIILDESFRHHLWLASPGGAGRNRVLNINEMLQYEIRIPSVPEQQQIATTLINLDNLITLHQRKLEKLKAIKKSMLEKMFV